MNNTLITHDELERLLKTFVSLQPLKELKRQGAIYYGERLAEADTIAGHSFTVASLAWLLARTLSSHGYDIDVEKTISMALAHDMGEAITGDLPTTIKPDDWEEIEVKAFVALTENLVDALELKTLFREYATLKSPEATIVKIADRLDAWIHALATPSVRPLIQAWCYYNKRTYDKIIARGREDSQNQALWHGLADLFKHACKQLVGMHVILLKRDEIEFEDPEWPAE